MKKFVEELIKPILLKEEKKITKIVGIYGGRFQPFGPHHYKTYKWLVRQVDEAYISTSDLKKLPRHPMNFKEKARHMKKMGVPLNKLTYEKSPFQAKNLEKKYDPETTAFVYVFGAKDGGRLGGSGKYFQDYKKNKKNLKGFEENGYYLTAPHVSVNIGGKEVSGTSMRTLLGSPKIDDSDREKLFKKMFGYFDKGVFQMMTNKFKKLFENLNEIEVPIEIGDTVMMGKFKNKKVVVKSIGFNEKGDLIINGKSASKFRLTKKPNIFDENINESKNIKKVLSKLKIPKTFWDDNRKLIQYFQTNPQVLMQFLRLVVEDVNIIKKDGKDGGDYRDYDSTTDSDWEEPHSLSETNILNFLVDRDIEKIIKEANTTGAAGALLHVDDGPSGFYGNRKSYEALTSKDALRYGWEVINYLIPLGEFELHNTNYPNGPIGDVSSAPTGIGTGKLDDRAEREHHTGAKAFKAYYKHINNIARAVGYEIIDYLGAEMVADHTLGNDEITDEHAEEMSINRKDVVDRPKGKKGVGDGMTGVKETLFTKNWWKKELLNEGGAYGHMAHPFDDKDLTFGDLKKIITDGLGGQLNREDNVTEKLDGQNIMISWKDGKLIAARNKGHLKNGGKTALSAKGIKLKFAGRGDIANAFNFAMTDLGKAIGSLSEKQRTKIFNNGYNFMNLEVMWPKSANVIDYDVATLVFHGALIYDDKGTVKGEVKGSASILAGMIKQVNQHIGKKYSIGKPNFLTVPKHQDFGKLKDKFLGQLTKLQKEFGLKDSDTLGMYHQSYWEEYIYNAAQQFGFTIPNKPLKALTKRWAFFDKSYKIPMIKKDFKNHPEFLEWVLKTDKEDHAKMVKDNMKPFEVLFFEVGAEILKNVSGYIAANPNKAVQGVKKKLDAAIKDVKAKKDLKKLNRLKIQMDRLNAIGGLSSIVPTEGIVFKYQGKTYKFTGAFAPVNQITGLMSF